MKAIRKHSFLPILKMVDIPRSKFYVIQLCCSHSWLKPEAIEVILITTLEQKADFLTKPLPPLPFQQIGLYLWDGSEFSFLS